MRDYSLIGWITLILVIVGGINWGLVGLFQFNLVTAIFGPSLLERVVYILVGVSAIYQLFLLISDRSKKV